MSTLDPERTPVVVTWGQITERTALTDPIELMVRAADLALAKHETLRHSIELVSVVDPMSKVGPAPATEVARALGLSEARCERSTVGGNTPQWFVNRGASAIAEGALSSTLIVGAEALRSQAVRRKDGAPRYEGDTSLAPDAVVGDALPGSGPAEDAIGLWLPVQIYPIFESAIAARLGRSGDAHRLALGALFAPFTAVAASHPQAWFPEVRTPEEIALVSDDNRMVCDPYTKRMTAFLGSDQSAALVVCSLAVARRAGLEDGAIYLWAGAEATDVRSITRRRELGRSPAIAAAGSALFAAASEAAGRSVTVDDLSTMDLYSCFPSAVEAATEALGIAHDDPRGLTTTGGLPYFGGPGNNYTTHGIATVCERLRQDGPDPTASPRLGLATGLGWYITKHALGLYSATPPPAGFRRGDTSAAQADIEDAALPITSDVTEETPATVVGATVVRDRDGRAVGAPMVVDLADGSRMAVAPDGDATLAEMGALDVCTLVGSTVSIQPGQPRYRLAR